MKVLAATPLFRECGDALADIDSRMRAEAWAAGEFLYVAGHSGDNLYVIASGRAKAVRSDPEGVDTIVSVLGPGDLCGSLWHLGETGYAESVQALHTTCALRISVEDFRRLLVDYPQVAVSAFDEVSRQLRDVGDVLAKTSTGTVTERVAHALCRLAEKFGESSADGLLLQLPLTRADLAAMTGATTESVSRVMSQMRRDGVISTGRQWTAVRDMSRLRELSGEFPVL
ncbi:MAG: Crp/Fnr family transcriptional regulator [Bowdeniella nasicola]|nr:Crp/Fnr family transcriptional regulator [Bowdeniella nasicola]